MSLTAMGAAAAGLLPAVWGALLQEAIDVAVILNALRALRPPAPMSGDGRPYRASQGCPPRPEATPESNASDGSQYHAGHPGADGDGRQLQGECPATRSMLAMTRRPSSSIRGMAAKVPSSSTTRAAEQLAWLPDPIAIPRSACLRAWTSLTPSPTIATTWPPACSARTAASLWPGLTLWGARTVPAGVTWALSRPARIR